MVTLWLWHFTPILPHLPAAFFDIIFFHALLQQWIVDEFAQLMTEEKKIPLARHVLSISQHVAKSRGDVEGAHVSRQEFFYHNANTPNMSVSAHINNNDSACVFEEKHAAAYAIGCFLTLGVLVSYIPQHIKIWRTRSSQGIRYVLTRRIGEGSFCSPAHARALASMRTCACMCALCFFLRVVTSPGHARFPFFL